MIERLLANQVCGVWCVKIFTIPDQKYLGQQTGPRPRCGQAGGAGVTVSAQPEPLHLTRPPAAAAGELSLVDMTSVLTCDWCSSSSRQCTPAAGPRPRLEAARGRAEARARAAPPPLPHPSWSWGPPPSWTSGRGPATRAGSPWAPPPSQPSPAASNRSVVWAHEDFTNTEEAPTISPGLIESAYLLSYIRKIKTLC